MAWAQEIRSLIDKEPPAASGIEIRASEDSIVMVVAGRGLFKGAAVIFSFLGCVFALFCSVGSVKYTVERDLVDLQGIVGTAVIALCCFVIGAWRGRFKTKFKIDEGTLTVTKSAPLIGSFRRRILRWTEIDKIELKWLKRANAFAPSLPCVCIETKGGGRFLYLTGYPLESIEFIVDLLARAC